MNDERGFSVLELLVVLGVIAISAGIILPVINGMKPVLRLDGAVSQLQGDLMWTRLQAISKNVEYRITYDTPHHCNNTPLCGKDYRSGDVDGDGDIDANDEVLHYYTIWVDDDGNGVLDAGIETNNAIIKDLHTSYFDVIYEFTGGGNDLVFSPRGNASNSTTFTLKSPNPNYPDEDSVNRFMTRTISINRSGRIKASKVRGYSNAYSP